jgi:hemerythrin-like domain-containing protein
MANVFDVLRKDHDEIKQALSELETGLSGDPPDLDHRTLHEKLVEHLVIEESKHEAVEEEYFWPAVREKLSDGDELADQAVKQEQDAKYVLNDLIGLSAEKPEFEELLRTLIHDGREHIAFEESQVWPKLEQALSAEEADELGDKLVQGKKIAPTRPHPHTPPKPGILKTAGPAVAAADKARDTITGRGKE